MKATRPYRESKTCPGCGRDKGATEGAICWHCFKHDAHCLKYAPPELTAHLSSGPLDDAHVDAWLAWRDERRNEPTWPMGL